MAQQAAAPVWLPAVRKPVLVAAQAGRAFGGDRKQHRFDGGPGRDLGPVGHGGSAVAETTGQHPVAAPRTGSFDGQTGRKALCPQPDGQGFRVVAAGKHANLQGQKGVASRRGPARRLTGRSGDRPGLTGRAFRSGKRRWPFRRHGRGGSGTPRPRSNGRSGRNGDRRGGRRNGGRSLGRGGRGHNHLCLGRRNGACR